MTVSAAEKSRPYYLLSDTPQYNHSGCHYSLQWVKNFFLKTDSGNISLTKTVKVKLFSWKKKTEKEDCICSSEMKWVWLLTRWLSVTKFCSLSLGSPKPVANSMFLTDRHSSQYISVCTGMKKSMSVHSHASSISASEPSYRHGKPSTEPTQRE